MHDHQLGPLQKMPSIMHFNEIDYNPYIVLLLVHLIQLLGSVTFQNKSTRHIFQESIT